MKLLRCHDNKSMLMFFCPGCEHAHLVHVAGSNSNVIWGWNGSMESPTFTPSYLVYETTPAGEYKGHPRCHSFVRDGQIEFLSDSTHALAGKTVPLPDWDDINHQDKGLGA